jgi:hypothetical protein
MDHTQEFYLTKCTMLWYQLKIKWLLIYRVCVQSVTKYQKCRIKRDRYFVKEVETQLREKPL